MPFSFPLSTYINRHRMRSVLLPKQTLKHSQFDNNIWDLEPPCTPPLVKAPTLSAPSTVSCSCASYGTSIAKSLRQQLTI